MKGIEGHEFADVSSLYFTYTQEKVLFTYLVDDGDGQVFDSLFAGHGHLPPGVVDAVVLTIHLDSLLFDGGLQLLYLRLFLVHFVS